MSLPAQDLRAKAAEGLLGETLSGRYRLDSIRGHGSMGTVFKAHHVGLHKDVAVKLLHPALTADEEMVARFDREAAAVSRLDHPNCVRVMDFGSTDDGRRYLVMEYLEGHDLADIATEPLPPFRVAELVRQILEGLAHAHGHGLVHRDIKHENIFVIDTENGEQVKVLDFGIAKVNHGAGAGQLTQAGMVFGTPHFMSPEQAKGEKTDARSDLYSLGIVMYSMLAGTLPFNGEDAVAILRQQIAKQPPPLPDSVPGSLRNFVLQLLAKDPEKRFPDAATAIAALRRAASPTQPPPEPTPESTETTSLQAVNDAPPDDNEATLPERDDERETRAVAPEAHSKPARPPWLFPAIGAGALGLLAVLVGVCSGGEDDETTPETAAAEGSAEDEQPTKEGEDDANAVVVEDDTPDGGEDDAEAKSARALRATLASVDALIESKEYEAARITIGPLLEVYAQEPELHWRMGRVLVALNRKNNATAALESYRAALALKPALIEDEAFSTAFYDLLDDPRHRELSTEIAIELLGDAGHERLAQWINVQKSPLPYTSRHAAIDHLRGNDGATLINEPLQTALDLWQASTAESPCEAFQSALEAATKEPDSYLLGTLERVTVPTTGEGEEAVECPGLAATLTRAREEYAQRYAGLDPGIPSAFQRRKPAPQSNNRRRRR